MLNPGQKLRERLARPDILVLPGVYDALSAKVAEQAGFDGLVMGGYAIAASRLAEPDVGYLSMTEMAAALRVITNAVDVPVLADGDTGYGNALSAQRTLREYEHAGAAGVLFEDQVWPKRCGHMAGKQVIGQPSTRGSCERRLTPRPTPILCSSLAPTPALYTAWMPL